MALTEEYIRSVLRIRAYTADLADINDAEFAMASHVLYTGNEQRPPVKAVCHGKELIEGTDYTLEYRNNTETGRAAVIVRGIGDYAMEKELSFEIAPLTIRGIEKTYSYTGKEIAPEVAVTFGETTLVKERDYTVRYRNNLEPGNAEVIVTGTNGYVFDAVLSFQIVRTPDPEKEDSGSSSPMPLILPQAAANRYALLNTSDPFESARHLTMLVISSLTALGSLLILRQRR